MRGGRWPQQKSSGSGGDVRLGWSSPFAVWFASICGCCDRLHLGAGLFTRYSPSPVHTVPRLGSTTPDFDAVSTPLHHHMRGEMYIPEYFVPHMDDMHTHYRQSLVELSGFTTSGLLFPLPPPPPTVAWSGYRSNLGQAVVMAGTPAPRRDRHTHIHILLHIHTSSHASGDAI